MHLCKRGVIIVSTNIVGAMHLCKRGVIIVSTNIIGALHLYKRDLKRYLLQILSVRCTFTNVV
jgi:hypothetical protein